MEETYGLHLDWNRWHELIEIQFQRLFTDDEKREYKAYLPIVAKFDAEELERGRKVLDKRGRRFHLPLRNQQNRGISHVEDGDHNIGHIGSFGYGPGSHNPD